MQIVIDSIKKIVVLVLLMELVIQLQSGKQYEPYIKMLVGIMVVYSIVLGMSGMLGRFWDFKIPPMQEYQWEGAWDMENTIFAEETDDITSTIKEIRVETIKIEEINVNEIDVCGGMR